jgi:hypothetical protein
VSLLDLSHAVKSVTAAPLSGKTADTDKDSRDDNNDNQQSQENSPRHD